MKTYINWTQATKQNAEVANKQKQKFEDFKNECHEMTDARDLQYWIHETGKDLFTLLENAPDIAPNIKNPLLNGATLDDIWDLIPEFIEDQDQEENLEFENYFKHLLNF